MALAKLNYEMKEELLTKTAAAYCDFTNNTTGNRRIKEWHFTCPPPRFLTIIRKTL
jgi:hypothetical protein